MNMYGLWEERQESILESYYWDTTSIERICKEKFYE
jgi:hypothetical protein